MRRTLRILLPVCLLGLAPFALAACGGDDSDSLPSNAVAKVGDVSITKSQFDHWMNVAATATAAQTGQTGDVAKVPDPPEFQQCIAARKKAAPKPEKGQPRTTDAQYREQCEQTYEQLRSTVMTFLITSQWIEQEAAERDITVTDQQVEKELDKLKEQQFQKESEYEDFLKSQGMTNDDVLFQQRLTMLRQKLQEQITKGKDKVTDAQIQAYYDKNKQRFATPETRDVRIILTKTEAQAEEAKQALEDGGSWKDVAKEYSIDDASKDTGGKLQGIAKGQQEKALDDAIFGAEKGELSGPVKTQFGWYVFEVEKITPAEQQSLEDAKETIKQIVTSENQQKALTQFEENWKKQFTAETVCRADFEVAECENAPKTETATTPTGATEPTG
ncbi:MAG TPA: peptidyl-prolyl cis-trans isomerase [Capillimicrobium sp.]|nr:peptidyl-prolyl cis-trans isomerase [Capillimicrobium sp.]